MQLTQFLSEFCLIFFADNINSVIIKQKHHKREYSNFHVSWSCARRNCVFFVTKKTLHTYLSLSVGQIALASPKTNWNVLKLHNTRRQLGRCRFKSQQKTRLLACLLNRTDTATDELRGSRGRHEWERRGWILKTGGGTSDACRRRTL